MINKMQNYGEIEKCKDEIISFYLGDYLSIRGISKITGFSISGIKRVLHKYKIRMRNKCESLNLCPKEFNVEETQIIIGSLLGDGSLSRLKGPKGESHFYEGHGKAQLSYLQWKYDKLKRFIGCRIYPLTHSLSGKKHTTYNFLTRKSPLFTNLRKSFYVDAHQQDSRKIVPYKIVEKWMTPLTLAVWIMDDGTRTSSHIIQLMSQSFSKDENDFLVKVLYEKFAVISKSVPFENGSGWILSIQTKDNTNNKINLENLKKIVSPHIHKDLAYKTF